MSDDFTLSDAGTGAFLFDVASGRAFDEARQGRLLAEGSAAELRRAKGTASLEEAFLMFASEGAQGGN